MTRAPYPVMLTQVDDGSIIAQVGCKTVVFPSKEALFIALRDYFDDPRETIARFANMHGWSLNEPAGGVGTVIGYGVNGRY